MMRTCILDGEQIRDRDMLHDILSEDLKLPKWYGRNLDALYDCLADMKEETQIVIKNQGRMEQHLGRYATKLYEVLCRAAEDNPCVICGYTEEIKKYTKE